MSGHSGYWNILNIKLHLNIWKSWAVCVLVEVQGGACSAAVVLGARAAGWVAASSSSLNRAAFVSRGCWSPCDQSCHSLFGERARAPGVTPMGGTGGGYRPPTPFSASSPAQRQGAQQWAWMIDYTVWALIGPFSCLSLNSHEEDRWVRLCIVPAVNAFLNFVVLQSWNDPPARGARSLVSFLYLFL